MVKRIIVAIPIVIIVALAVFIQGWVLAIFAAALALMCQFEVVRALDGNGRPLIKTVSFLFAGVLAVWFLWAYNGTLNPDGESAAFDGSTVLILFVLLALAAFIVEIISKGHSIEKVWNTVFTFVYPQLFFVFFYLMIFNTALVGDGSYYAAMVMLLMAFLPAMFTDTFAYFFGRAFGKKKLCPEISPKKTVVGSVAGIAGGVIAALIVWALFYNTIGAGGAHTDMRSFSWFITVGAVLAVISQFGDLSASLIKRSLGIKDFGRLLPGHGGVVDRMDSILFSIPVLYLFQYILVW